MKDLKHLIYFENLLQEANNELVQKAVADGDRALGYNCYYVPEVLLNLPGSFSSRLRAPNCTSPDVATYYMIMKKVDTWIIWFVVDILYVAEYFLLPDRAWYLIGLNLIWTVMAVGSYISWSQKAKETEHE